jgi:hypothetical protein
MGYSVGDIKITTDGQFDFTVSADGGVTQGPNEVVAAGLPRTIALDDVSAPDTIPPAVSITAPSNGATVVGSIAVTASATDNVGVARVEFYVDGVLKNTDTAAPWTWTWDTNTATNGTHTLLASAFDGAGNTNNSASVAVTVNNSTTDTQAPTVPANLTATRGTGSITLQWTASTDNVGVTGYQVWRATSGSGPFTQIATPTATTFTDSGLPSGARRFYYVKAFDAAGNVSAQSITVNARAR